jgi:hypothetical protein
MHSSSAVSVGEVRGLRGGGGGLRRPDRSTGLGRFFVERWDWRRTSVFALFGCLYTV